MELADVIADMPSLAERREWMGVNSAKIAALVEAPCLAEVSQRIFRLRYWLDGEFIMVTLCDNRNVAAPTPQQIVPKVQVFAVRSYLHAAGGSSVARLDLGPGYSTDEIAAFLRLDLVDPDSVEWRDETRYSNLAIVGNILRSVRPQD